MSDNPVVIVAAKRTPIGRYKHSYAEISATALASMAMRELLPAKQLAMVDQVIMGCVLSAGLGQAPARQAALAVGVPSTAGCATVNKMCGSGLYALQLASQYVRLHDKSMVVAGGMENMTRAPFLLLGARLGHAVDSEHIADHLMRDGLLDAYQSGAMMSDLANDFAAAKGIDRKAQDDWAKQSLQRSQAAWQEGYFKDECVTVDVEQHSVKQDACFEKFSSDKIAKLQPLKQGGSITAANASAMADGAACLCVMREAKAAEQGLKVLARVLAFAQVGGDPRDFPGLPADAIQQCLDELAWSKDSVTCFEINEAFAAVAVWAIRELDLAPERVNAWGGACALGHPLGATGARLVVTLIHRLRQAGGGRGIASLCLAGGEALAVAIEVNKEDL